MDQIKFKLNTPSTTYEEQRPKKLTPRMPILFIWKHVGRSVKIMYAMYLISTLIPPSHFETLQDIWFSKNHQSHLNVHIIPNFLCDNLRQFPTFSALTNAIQIHINTTRNHRFNDRKVCIHRRQKVTLKLSW